jgi:hypothetical protein
MANNPSTANFTVRRSSVSSPENTTSGNAVRDKLMNQLRPRRSHFQTHITRMRHDRFVAQLGEQSAHPRGMRPGFQRDATRWHLLEPLLHRFRAGRDSLLQNHISRSVQDTVETRSITQIEADGQLFILQFSAPA